MYIQLRPLSSKSVTLHVDVQTQGKHMYRFSLSSMYKSVRMRLGKVAEIPLRLPRRWCLLALDTHRLLELVTQGHVRGQALQFIRAVKLCCSMAVRSVWTSDEAYTPSNLHKDLALHVPRGSTFGDMYAFLWVPAPPPGAEHKFASALAAEMALDSQALSSELHSTAHDATLPPATDEDASPPPHPPARDDASMLDTPLASTPQHTPAPAAASLARLRADEQAGRNPPPPSTAEPPPSAGMGTSATPSGAAAAGHGVSWQAQDSKGNVGGVQPPPVPDAASGGWDDSTRGAGIATRQDVLNAADDIMAHAGVAAPSRTQRNEHGPRVPSTSQVPTSMGVFNVPPVPEELNVSGSVVDVGPTVGGEGGGAAMLGPEPSAGAQVAEALKGPTRGPTVSSSDPVMSLAGVMGVASARQGALQWAPSGEEVVFPVGRVITALRVTRDGGGWSPPPHTPSPLPSRGMCWQGREQTPPLLAQLPPTLAWWACTRPQMAAPKQAAASPAVACRLPTIA